jgi:cytochrome c oxidase subunit 2
LLGLVTAHSPNASDMNTLFWVMIVVAIALVVVVNVALVALVIRYRGGRGVRPRRLRSRGRAQLRIAGVFAVVAAAVFALGVIFTDRAVDVEASGPNGLQAGSATTAQRGIRLPAASQGRPLVIEASGQQWIWRYGYPDGTFSYYQLVVPVDTTVVVDLGSTDVVHRWWVPGLSAKEDAVPGEANQTWFKADREGTYYGASYAFSGASYAAMRTEVRVVSVPQYQVWLRAQGTGIKAAQDFVQAKLAQEGAPGTEGYGGAP